MAASAKDTVKSVELSGQVILKILQHCNESLPQLVTGQLLGLDVGQTLEVTDCFAFPVGGRSTVYGLQASNDLAAAALGRVGLRALLGLHAPTSEPAPNTT